MNLARRWRSAVGVVVVAGIGLTAANHQSIRAKLLVARFPTAAVEDRRELAERLFALDSAGRSEIETLLRGGDADSCEAVVAAAERQQPRPNLFEAFETYSSVGQVAVLRLVGPSPGPAPEGMERAVATGLRGEPGVKVAAVAAATRLHQPAVVLPLMSDPEPAVRVAVLTALGTHDTAELLGDEDLFRWLNDPSADVRRVTVAVLQARGRSSDEIDRGRRLTHPSAHERLGLVHELATDGTRDIGPWLERLGGDANAAVRAAAGRVAFERKVLYADWAEQLATADPDPTVRHVVTFHKHRAAALRAVRFEP